MKKKTYALGILNVLMNCNGYKYTNELCKELGCDRKTVYRAIDDLEINGFGIDIKQDREGKKYKYNGLFGRSY